jgi:hypothetical protein
MTTSTTEKKAAPAKAEVAVEKTKDALLKEAYQAATRRLRDEQRAEFNRIYAEEASTRGVEWKPKPTAEEKAAQQMADLLAKFPHLAPGADTPDTSVTS